MTYNVNGRLIELKEDSGIIVNSHRFYQNCIEPITENASCPYLYLKRNGWMASISYFELMDDYFAAMKRCMRTLILKTYEYGFGG